MCFKTIKLVNINKNLMYYIIPENSEFAIVLAYKEINYAKKYKNFLDNLEDLIFHPYSKFFDSPENFKQCLNSIDKTIPKEVNNLILPTIIMDLPGLEEIEKIIFLNQNKELSKFNDPDHNEETHKIEFDEKEEDEKKYKYQFQNKDKNINDDFINNYWKLNKLKSNKDFKIKFKFFENLNNFLQEIKNRNYRVISFELKIKLNEYKNMNNLEDNNIFSKNNLKFSNEYNNDDNFQKNSNYSIISNLNNQKITNLTNSYHNFDSELNKTNSKNFSNLEFNNNIANTTEHITDPFYEDKMIKNKKCCSIKRSKHSFSKEKESIKSYSEQYIKLVKIFLKENLDTLKSFQQVFITFDFDFNNKYTLENSCSKRNEYIAFHFKKLLIKFDLENVTLIHHINFNLRNEQTQLDDQYHYLDYVFFNRHIADDLYKKLFLFKHSKQLKKISRKKYIMHKLLSEFLYNFKHDLFNEGRFDYSFQILKNIKIVPMQINSNSTMIFMNN